MAAALEKLQKSRGTGSFNSNTECKDRYVMRMLWEAAAKVIEIPPP